MGLKVRAVAEGDVKYAGYYDLKRRAPGEEFVIADENEFSHLWMEAVGWTPKPMTATQVMAKKEIIKPAMPTAIDVRKELEKKQKSFKKEAPVVVEKEPVVVNVEDKSHNPSDDVI